MATLSPVEGAFIYVLVGAVAVMLVIAVLSLVGERYDHIGRGGLFEDGPPGGRGGGGGGGAVPPAVAAAEADEEVRQMMEARNARRRARGQAELDVDAEVARLTGATAAADPSLVAEVRQLVEMRNRRRVRKGQEPLDVEAEVARQLRDLTG